MKARFVGPCIFAVLVLFFSNLAYKVSFNQSAPRITIA